MSSSFPRVQTHGFLSSCRSHVKGTQASPEYRHEPGLCSSQPTSPRQALLYNLQLGWNDHSPFPDVVNSCSWMTQCNRAGPSPERGPHPFLMKSPGKASCRATVLCHRQPSGEGMLGLHWGLETAVPSSQRGTAGPWVSGLPGGGSPGLQRKGERSGRR